MLWSFKNLNNNLEMYYDNLKMNQNILKYAHKYNVKKLIACLSTCIFQIKQLSYKWKDVT